MHHDCEDQEQIYSMSHGAAFDTFGPHCIYRFCYWIQPVQIRILAEKKCL